MKKKLAIVTSHPIQYNAPWFRLLNEQGRVLPKVFYTWSQVQHQQKYDPGFGKVVQWDIPLLDGYDHCFVENISTEPGTHHYKGLINPTLINEIEAWQPDAVLVFGWAFHSHARCLRHFHKKKPVLFRGDSTLLDETGGLKTFLRRIFLRWMYRNVDKALYVGSNNKKYFLAHGLTEQQLVYAPHAVDNDRFGHREIECRQKALALRESAGFAKEDVVLLFAGKFEQKKDPFLLIELLKRIDSPQLKLLFVGNGVLEKELKAAAFADQRISFMDFQNQQAMPALYRAADIFVLPSKGPGETWGLALNEAMACGRPVITTDKTGGAIDLVSNGVNGFIICDHDTQAVETFLKKAIQDKNILESMGERSKEIISEFNFEKIVAAVAAALD